MSGRIEKMKREIERAGGIVYLGNNLPDKVAEAFLDSILACPDCATAMTSWDHDMRTKTSADQSGPDEDKPGKREHH